MALRRMDRGPLYRPVSFDDSPAVHRNDSQRQRDYAITELTSNSVVAARGPSSLGVCGSYHQNGNKDSFPVLYDSFSTSTITLPSTV